MAKNDNSGSDSGSKSGSDFVNGSGSELTPLQRYLAKQKADGAAVPSAQDLKSSGTGSSRFRSSAAAAMPAQGAASTGTSSERVSSAPEPRGSSLPPHSEDSAPQAPPTDSAPFWRAKTAGHQTGQQADQQTGQTTDPQTSDRSSNAGANPTASGTTEPAPFFQRALAYFIDLFIVSKIVSLMTFSSVAGFYFSTNISEWLYSPIQFLVFQIVAFVYYGWFYREKGATPGKLIFGLEISTDAGLRGDERLSYIRTYFRESIGKMVSAALLFMGFFLAAFRKDHRALHDLLFETRVVKRRKKSGGA